MTAIAVLDTVTLDALHPGKLARFYSEILDLPIIGESHDHAQLAPYVPGTPSLLFLQVPDVKSGKNRWHLDFQVDDVVAAIKRCEELGAQRVSEGPLAGPFRWQVMFDPEGNEFCLCPPGPPLGPSAS